MTREDKRPIAGALSSVTHPSISPNRVVTRVSRLPEPFVGRHEELALLTALLEEAGSGQPRVAVLVGEAGIGKTRTARELARRATDSDCAVRVLWGRNYEGEKSPPYGVWTAVLREYLRRTEAEVPAPGIGPEVAELASLLPPICSRLSRFPPALPLPPVEARERLFDALLEFLRVASRERLLLLILDNLQWADPDSLRILERLLPEGEGMRVLAVGTYRESDVSARHRLSSLLGELSKEAAFAKIHLAPLADDHVREYAESVLGQEVPGDLLSRIEERSDGNPLLLRELVRELREAERPEENDGRVPRGVMEAVSRRAQRLPESSAQVLRAAAVVGGTFELTLLSELLGRGEEEVIELLEPALGEELLEEVDGEVGLFRFSHALVRDALAADLSNAKRWGLHLRVGELLLGGRSGSEAGSAVQAFRHFSCAGVLADPERLLGAALRAAEYALSCSAPEEAETVLGQALEWIRSTQPNRKRPADSLLAEALHLQGRALGELFRVEDSIGHLTRAFEVYERLGDVHGALRVASTPTMLAIGDLPGRYLSWQHDRVPHTFADVAFPRSSDRIVERTPVR